LATAVAIVRLQHKTARSQRISIRFDLCRCVSLAHWQPRYAIISRYALNATT